MSVKLDVDRFASRLKKLYDFWENGSDETFNGVDSIAIVTGKLETVYCKSLSLQNWLFGYEITDTIVIFCKKELNVLCGKKKVDFFNAVTKTHLKPYELNLICRNPADGDQEGIAKLLSAMQNSGKGKTLGRPVKDKLSSSLTEAFDKVLSSSSIDTVDISSALSEFLAAKAKEEIKIMEDAARVTCTLFEKQLKARIIEVIISEKKVKQDKLAGECENGLQKRAITNGLSSDALEMCYDPIVQSGGEYELKFSSKTNSKNLHFGTIVCALGVRNQSYCSNVIRTLLVNPTSDQTANYTFLNELIDWAIEQIKPGMSMSDFSQSIVDKVTSDRPELAEKLVRSFGFVTGIEFRDSSQLISAKSTSKFVKNMTINLTIGFQNLTNKSGSDKAEKIYALWLGDVVAIGLSESGGNSVLTSTAKRRPKAVFLHITEDDDEEDGEEQGERKSKKSKEAAATNGKSRGSGGGSSAENISNGNAAAVDTTLGRGHRRAIIEQKTRNEATSEDKRMTRRMELFSHLLTDSVNRLKGLTTKNDAGAKAKSTVAYKGAGQMPNEDDVRKLRLFVDKKYEAVILPVFGYPMPFHVSTIKNVSTSIENDYTYLRINFHHPGATINVKDSANFLNPDATFVKEMTFRASNQRRHNEVSVPATNLNNTYRIIKEVLKRYRSREAEERERADLVEQDELIIDRAKGAFRLKDLYIRPNIISKRITGTLEAHTNGFRFTSIRGDHVDILYNNIKHAFYQPCDGEMIILLHFHLKNAIMYGKKKQLDIQFYTEVGELITDLSKVHGRMQDRDDIEAEQRERDMREKIKGAFRNFVDRAETLAKRYSLEFESPFRDLGFYGCPHRSTVFLMPTSGSLVGLTEMPPFVITLEEIEFVMMERVSLSIRTFDMIFIPKDYKQKPAMINSIPATSLEHVKEWLISCDKFYAEASRSLNWPKLMKTIVDDPDFFINEGGWQFISPEDKEQSGSEDNSEDEDENYAPSVSSKEGGEEGSGSAQSSSADSDDSEDWDAEDEEDDSEDGSLDSDESEGKDWDELERIAQREDMKNELLEGESPTKKRPHPSGGSSSKKHHQQQPSKKPRRH